MTLISLRSIFPFLSMSNILKMRNDYIIGSAFASSITAGSWAGAPGFFDTFTLALVMRPRMAEPDWKPAVSCICRVEASLLG